MNRSLSLAVVALLAAACQSPQATVGDGEAGEPFFVGRWAAAETACGHEAWTFTPTGLETPGEVACTFTDVRRVPEGYDIEATCTAEGPPTPQRLRLSYAQLARAFLVEGGPFQPVGLIACGGAGKPLPAP